MVSNSISAFNVVATVYIYIAGSATIKYITIVAVKSLRVCFAPWLLIGSK